MNFFLTAVFGYLVLLITVGLALYLIIKGAVRAALEEHYKTVRWYERTGEWAGRRAPRSFTSTVAEASVK